MKRYKFLFSSPPSVPVPRPRPSFPPSDKLSNYGQLTYSSHKRQMIRWVNNLRPEEGVRFEINIIFVYKQPRGSLEGASLQRSVCILDQEKEYQLPSGPQTHSLLVCLYQIKLRSHSRGI